MLDLKFIRENTDLVKKSIKDRAAKVDLDEIVKLDAARRKVLTSLDGLRSEKNKANDEISVLLKEKKDPKKKIAAMKKISTEIGKLEKELKKLEPKLYDLILTVPNIPHESLPVGAVEKNKVIRSWREPKKPDFSVKTHDELAEKLDIIDFKRATKITGSNFILYKVLDPWTF